MDGNWTMNKYHELLKEVDSHKSQLTIHPYHPSTPFQEVTKLQKLNLFLKKALRPILKTTALFHFSLCYKKLLKGLFMIKLKSFWVKTNFCTNFSRVFKKTTNTCLGHLTDEITTGFEKGLFTRMVLIDLQKVFDTIDHQILLKKMKYLGFS